MLTDDLHIAVGRRIWNQLWLFTYELGEARLTVEGKSDGFEREVRKSDIESRADSCRRDSKTDRPIPFKSAQRENEEKEKDPAHP